MHLFNAASKPESDNYLPRYNTLDYNEDEDYLEEECNEDDDEEEDKEVKPKQSKFGKVRYTYNEDDDRDTNEEEEVVGVHEDNASITQVRFFVFWSFRK